MGDVGFTVVPVVIAVGFALIGTLQVVIGGVAFRRALRTRRVQQRAVPARATVVSVRQDRRLNDDDRINRYDEWTTVRYAHPRTESVHEVEVPVPNGLRGRQPGEEVDVVVDPQDPAMVLPPGVHSTVALVVTGVIVAFGVVVLVAVAVVAFDALTSNVVDVPFPDDPSLGAP